MFWYSGAVMSHLEVLQYSDDSNSELMNPPEEPCRSKSHDIEDTSIKVDTSILDNCKNKCHLKHCILLSELDITERVESSCFLIS